MAIHHATVKAAEKLGFTLEEKGEHVRAFAAQYGQQIFGVSAKDAFNQMSAMLKIIERNPDLRLRHVEGDLITHGNLYNTATGGRTGETNTPVAFYRDLNNLKFVIADDSDDDVLEMHSPSEGEPGYRKPIPDGYKANEPINEYGNYFAEDGTLMNADGTRSVFDDVDEGFDEKPEVSDKTAPIKRNEKGVPFDGAIAYAEGIMAADNPFEEGTEEGDLWDSQWDQAADDAPEQDNSEKGGSVVASKYRTKYAEQGHPNHCGDWLAELLNNFCVGDKHTDLITFERICGLNGIDTSKYKREGTGWQGRIRMTGRNLLAKKVFSTGKIVVPNGETEDGVQEIVAPADWIAAQRYSKPKSE